MNNFKIFLISNFYNNGGLGYKEKIRDNARENNNYFTKPYQAIITTPICLKMILFESS